MNDLKQKLVSMLEEVIPGPIVELPQLVDYRLVDKAQVAFLFRGRVFRVMLHSGGKLFVTELRSQYESKREFCNMIKWKYSDYTTELKKKLQQVDQDSDRVVEDYDEQLANWSLF